VVSERNRGFAPTIKLADNSSMTDPGSDPPETLAAAVEKFKNFLASQGYPDTIRWLMRENVLVDRQGRFWVRDCETKALQHANLRYLEGVGGNLGIALQAVCATDSETFASVFVPSDDMDRQYNLMGRGLKLSCRTPKMSASIVTNPVRWWILQMRLKHFSKMLDL